MPRAPVWYDQLTWSVPLSVAVVRARIHARANPIPPRPGCYVFTDGPGAMVPGDVLYVGKAIDLKSRVRGYLVDYMTTAATKHKGRAFVFEYRHLYGDDRLFVRWAIYGDPVRLEGALIEHLEPQMNDRLEAVELADDESLDPDLMP
jgi:excinuclease UvrABC nuclease subunit